MCASHSAWNQFVRTRNPQPPAQPKIVACTGSNLEDWIDRICPVCEMSFVLGVKVIVNGRSNVGLMVHLECA